MCKKKLFEQLDEEDIVNKIYYNNLTMSISKNKYIITFRRGRYHKQKLFKDSDEADITD